MDRKDFFRKIGLGVGATVATSLTSVFANFEEDDSLTTEQKEFLGDYKNWLTEFQLFVNNRNNDVADTNNNLKLMELSAQAEKRKPALEVFMKDRVFANYFNTITQEITENIT